MNEQPPVIPYTPEKPDHIRTAVKTLITLLIFHGLSLAFHFMAMGSSDPYTMSSDAASRIPTAMFLFSLVALFVLGDLLVGVYFKDGKRKRAFLEATSAEKRGEEGAAEGHARYCRLALTEALVCTLTTAALAVLYALCPGLFQNLLGLNGSLMLLMLLSGGVVAATVVDQRKRYAK